MFRSRHCVTISIFTSSLSLICPTQLVFLPTRKLDVSPPPSQFAFLQALFIEFVPHSLHFYKPILLNLSNTIFIYVTPLPFLQCSSLLEFWKQLALGVFQIFKKKTILTRPIKIHTHKLWCEVYEIDSFFYALFMRKYHSCFIFMKHL